MFYKLQFLKYVVTVVLRILPHMTLALEGTQILTLIFDLQLRL